MKMIRSILAFLFLFTFLTLTAYSAEQHIGSWSYEVLNTPSGDYLGEMIIEKNGERYAGRLKSNSGSYELLILKMEADSLVFQTHAEGFQILIAGVFNNDEYKAKVEVMGDLEHYWFHARKLEEKEFTIQLKNQDTKEQVTYAHISFNGQQAISNLDGIFRLRTHPKTMLSISALGYQEEQVSLGTYPTNSMATIYLTAAVVDLPSVTVSAKKTRPKAFVEDIIKTAINRIPHNYIQGHYSADLFYRKKILDSKDSLVYQSEALLDFYDAKAYQKTNWRENAKSRYAKLNQARILAGKTSDKPKLEELNSIFVFWSHDPILDRQKPFSLSTLDAYDFTFKGLKQLGKELVYEIDFNCKNLKTKNTGLPSLKQFSGTLYINKTDYALIRYECFHIMDYEYENKRTRKDHGGAVRKVVTAHKIETYTKQDGKYCLSYGHDKTRQDFYELDKGTQSTLSHEEEIQLLKVKTTEVEVLDQNLFNFDNQTSYNPDFWEKFNIILDKG